MNLNISTVKEDKDRQKLKKTSLKFLIHTRASSEILLVKVKM